MRTLLILRGAPGAGKSTWIKEHNLGQYTLSPDDLRMLCNSTDLQADGTFAIARNQETEQVTWKILFQLLEYRMSRGEFTIIDATASKTKDIQRYKELADSYRYRMICVDFTDVPLQQCLAQNKMRSEFKQVPEEAIKNIYSRFATQKVPGSVKIIKPDELDTILDDPIDLSTYNKIVFIGDIHGCYNTLMQYFKDGLDKNTEYIFCGDYIDRGNQNIETMKWLYSIMNEPNVCLLEGNHEHWLQAYGSGAPALSKEFEYKTKPQLIAGGFTEKDARMFYRKVRQMSHFSYNGIEVLACHGGIPNLSTNLIYLPTCAFTKGVGAYEEYTTIMESWMRDTKENQYLVHGHRNVEDDDIRSADRVFNLEGKIEFGGKLRIVELNSDLSWNTIELEDCQPINEKLITEERKIETVEEAVAYLRNNKFVTEKQLGDGISSFNFTREAFFKANWTRQTILARGLFIDTINNKIMARSYEKFFKINEVPATDMQSLRTKLEFPVTAYIKENGFLGIVSYDYNKDDLFIASKSTNKGDFANYIREAFTSESLILIKDFLKYSYEEINQSVTLVFECEDIEHDPHIIQYTKNRIVLLDVVFNTLKFKTFNYKALCALANLIKCPVKEKAFELKDWDALRDLYINVQDEDYKYKDNYIEGFVFVDNTGFMTKCKTGYYNFWKSLRPVADQTLRCGYITKTGALQTSEANYFYGFCRDLYNNDRDIETKTYPYKTDIISLRDKFKNKEERRLI